MGKFIPVDPDRWAELVKAARERDALIVEVSHLTEENLLVREESDRHYGLFIKANAEVERWESENKLKAVRIEAQILDRLVELKAEVERLTKAGDAICKSFDEFGQVDATTLKGWQAAKSPTPLP
jgi:phage host-nuclease inhibitor protein Gam